ncbi:hypothetical protein [uncultured Methanobrevibacter sp.]|uniref:hypothetical protein n=1 Tax=uncultured Methanobrevibacter sp. TaxID=253161 RepID=UPI0025EA9127|nr:hypothetical protein [uncultured Methanobrevibacter sp.]
MLVFKVEIRVQADAPDTEEMKKTFMENAEDVIQQGLDAMTVPDWIANVIDIEEEDE